MKCGSKSGPDMQKRHGARGTLLGEIGYNNLFSFYTTMAQHTLQGVRSRDDARLCRDVHAVFWCGARARVEASRAQPAASAGSCPTAGL